MNYLGHVPAGGSFQQVDHFRQIMLTGEFKMYDHEFGNPDVNEEDSENVRRYG